MAGDTSELFSYHRIPAICDDAADDPVRRAEGEPLSPELGRGLDFLARVKGALPLYEWESQYCCNPRAAASGQADLSLLKRIDAGEVPDDVEAVRGWDWAVTVSEAADYSAGALCAYNKPRDELYILHVWRGKLPWPKLETRIVEMAHADKGETLTRYAAEAVAGFGTAFDSLREKLKGVVTLEKRNPPKGGKLIRAQQWFVKVEASRVYLVRGAWNKDFLDELAVFPLGKHDDQVDAVSVAFEALTKGNVLLYG
jgi:predicted phage terminase large subunit-like protein